MPANPDPTQYLHNLSDTTQVEPVHLQDSVDTPKRERRLATSLLIVGLGILMVVGVLLGHTVAHDGVSVIWGIVAVFLGWLLGWTVRGCIEHRCVRSTLFGRHFPSQKDHHG